MTESVLFLHISDIHIDLETEISDLHLSKISEVVNIYKSYNISHIIIIISGDLTYSGKSINLTIFLKLSEL